MEPVAQRKPRYRRTGGAPIELTPRDIAIIRQVARHRFIRSTDLDELFPEASRDKLRRRLDAMFQSGYLERPRHHRERYRTGGGSPPMTYALGNKGANLLAEEPGFRRAAVDWTAKGRDSTYPAIQHALGVTRFMVRLEAACRALPATRVLYLDEILSTMAPAATRANPRPYFWAVPVQWAGKHLIVHPIPDKIFGIEDRQREDGRQRRFFFFEEDQGTMPVARADDLTKTSFLRKLLAYGHTYRNDLHKSVYGFPNMRVLTVTNGGKRIDNIIAAHKKYTWRLCSPKVFLFADRASLARAESFWEYPWLDAEGGQHRLLD